MGESRHLISPWGLRLAHDQRRDNAGEVHLMRGRLGILTAGVAALLHRRFMVIRACAYVRVSVSACVCVCVCVCVVRWWCACEISFENAKGSVIPVHSDLSSARELNYSMV